MQFDFILAMKDETLGRRVRWIEDHKGCQDTAVRESFLHMGNEVTKEFHSCVLLEHKKLQSAHFPDIFGISCSCMNCFFPKEPFTKPFSVFLFLFEVNLAKSIFWNTEIWNWSVSRMEIYVFGLQKQAIWLDLKTTQYSNTPLTTWAGHDLFTFLMVFLHNFSIPSWNKGEGH